MEASNPDQAAQAADPLRYRIVRKLDVGGMAEIFLGKSRALGDLEKDVAIKRILPSLAADPTFVEMFLDEARLSMRLNHANIVQVFDVGKSGDSWFLVMEWVDGPNLRRVLHKAQEIGYRIPVGIACYLIIELCKGLSHAHTRANDEGQSLDIVHRDVSPPNILISRSGEVKITDFGLSKAMSHSSVTEPGVVKGKFAYLAPEAAEGQDVDLRADVFAAGLCLWELLAGEKLFQGSDDLEVLEKVRAARIPALEGKHPDVTPELDGILARALSRAPDERFGSCQALGNELTNYLFSRQLKANSYDLGAMISYLFDQEGERPPWKERLDRLFDDEIALLDEVVEDGKEPWRSSQPIDISTWNLPASDGAPGEELWAQIDRLPPPTTPASADESRSSSLLDRLEGPRTRHELDETGSSGRGWLPWAIGAGLVALIGLGWFLSSGGS